MADIAPEIGIRAVLEKPAAGAPATPARVEARAIRDKAAVKGPDAALSALREAGDKVAGKDPKQVIDEAISNTNPTARGVRRGAELARYNEAIKVADQVERGYAALTPVEKGVVEVVVENVLNSSPDIVAFIDTLVIPPLDRAGAVRKVAQNILTNPAFAAFLKQSLRSSTDQSKIPAEIDNEILRAYRQAEAVVGHKMTEQTGVVADLATTNTDMANIWGAIPGSKGERLGIFSGEKATFEQAVEDANTEKSRLEREKAKQIVLRRQAQLMGPAGAADVATANAEINAIDLAMVATEGALSVAQDEARRFSRTGKLAELNQLQQEKAELVSKQGRLKDRKDALDTEILTANQNLALPHLELSQAMNQRLAQEKVFCKGMEGVFNQATIDFITTELTKAEKARTDLNEEAKTVAKANADKEVADVEVKALEGLATKWETNRTIRVLWNTKTVRETDKAQVRTDYDTLLTSGPEAFMRTYLLRVDPTLNIAKLNALIANRELMDRLQPQVLEALLAKRIDGGMGKIQEGEARRIAASPWGKELITKAIGRNEAIQKEIDALRAKGIVSGDFLTWLNKQSGMGLAALLIWLFGTVGAVAGAAVLGGALPALGVGGASIAGGVGTRAYNSP